MVSPTDRRPFLQQAAPAVSFTIHANAITNTPRCTATGQHRFIGQLSPAFSNREVLGGCLGEPYAGRDISRRKVFWRIDILTIDAPLDSNGMLAEHLATANREFPRAAFPRSWQDENQALPYQPHFYCAGKSAPESTFFSRGAAHTGHRQAQSGIDRYRPVSDSQSKARVRR